MDKHKLNDTIIDELIKYAAEQEVDRLADQFTDEAKAADIKYSPGFDLRMRRLFKQTKKQERRTRVLHALPRVGVAAAVLLLLSIPFIMSVDAFRLPLLNYFNEISHHSTVIRVDETAVDYGAIKDKIHNLYLPSYITPNYSFDSFTNDKQYCIITFSNDDGEVIILRSLIKGNSIGADSEESNVVELIINNEPAQYFSKDGFNMLVFKYNDAIFMISATVDKDEIIKIAESMKLYP